MLCTCMLTAMRGDHRSSRKNSSEKDNFCPVQNLRMAKYLSKKMTVKRHGLWSRPCQSHFTLQYWGRGKKLSPYKQGQVSSLCEEGLSMEKIADQIGRSYKAIYTFLANPKAYNGRMGFNTTDMILRYLQRCFQQEQVVETASWCGELFQPRGRWDFNWWIVR